MLLFPIVVKGSITPQTNHQPTGVLLKFLEMVEMGWVSLKIGDASKFTISVGEMRNHPIVFILSKPASTSQA